MNYSYYPYNTNYMNEKWLADVLFGIKSEMRCVPSGAPVFIDGKKAVTLCGPTVAAEFKQMVIDYIERRYGSDGAGRTAAEQKSSFVRKFILKQYGCYRLGRRCGGCL